MTFNANDQIDRITFPIQASAVLAVLGAMLLGVYAWKVADLDKTLVFLALLTAGFGQILVSFYTARTLAAIVRRDHSDSEKSRADQERRESSERAALERQERLDQAAAIRVRILDEAENRRIVYEKRKEAMRFGSRWNDPQMASSRDTFRQLSSKRAAPQEVIDFAKENVVSVSHIMNFLEEIGTAHRAELVDNELLKEQFDFVVTHAWETLYVWICKVRESAGSDIWEDTETLYHAWRRH